ncbi:AAA family ATPase [Ohtaekwangia koreensis]|uniref:AAA domain-containing protein, putative AbiEii toxin, Type IV TA system n=1 Tax=Ohtaekwangia koreensis TaxID=688867 RepID=A0A1T5ITI3_9BACT|nr:AAA family ATPase [Ohtaekwangia koreensis]SKC42481.1 AAA domain-containing protein, putative AbiEii toxin, Type IV TA system [Ohtaekwangia koreensis]
MADLRFKMLTLTNWKQFSKVDIEFHPNLTVLTGANGSGKTTMLNILSRHFGWEHSELATPAKDEETGIFKFFTRFFKSPSKSNDNQIGELHYSNSNKATLTIPSNNSPQYQIAINGRQTIKGISIPSHRSTYFYRQVSQISTTKRSKQEAFNLVKDSSINFFYGSGGQTSSFYIKETLLNWAIGGEGNKFIEADKELQDYFLGFQTVLSKVLPRTLGFKEITIRNYEIVLITDSGDFMLDAVSGGVSAIIDLAWQIYTFTNKGDEFMTVLIDEVENHLHPNMQRSILPDLLIAFPNTQFIVSTHSPLIVGSVKDSNVYAFRHVKNEQSQLRVANEKLDLVNKAKTATEILNEVLGVPFTMPLWVEASINEIVDKYSKEAISEDSFDKMRNELKQIGLEDMMPEAMKNILKDDKTD